MKAGPGRDDRSRVAKQSRGVGKAAEYHVTAYRADSLKNESTSTRRSNEDVTSRVIGGSGDAPGHAVRCATRNPRLLGRPRDLQLGGTSRTRTTMTTRLTYRAPLPIVSGICAEAKRKIVSHRTGPLQT